MCVGMRACDMRRYEVWLCVSLARKTKWWREEKLTASEQRAHGTAPRASVAGKT